LILLKDLLKKISIRGLFLWHFTGV